MKDIKEVAKFIKESVESLKDGSATNCRLKLDDRLAIFVGWSAGYGNELRDDIIQDKDEPDFGINAGVKVWTSDDMWTDFDYLNFPYYEDGDVLDMSLSIEPSDEKDDYITVANDLINWYKEVKDLNIDEDGKIIEGEESEDDDVEEVEDEEPHLATSDLEAGQWYESKEKEIKEDLNSNPYKNIIAEYFDYSGDFDFLEIVSDIIDRIEDFADDDDIFEAMDSALIYTADQWKVLEHYCSPQDASWDNAWDDLYNDISAICSEINSQDNEEEEE